MFFAGSGALALHVELNTKVPASALSNRTHVEVGRTITVIARMASGTSLDVAVAVRAPNRLQALVERGWRTLDKAAQINSSTHAIRVTAIIVGGGITIVAACPSIDGWAL